MSEAPWTDAAGLRDRIAELLAVRDKPSAVRVAVEAVTEGRIGIAELYRDVLTPLLADVGGAWQRGRVAVWEEHLASAAVRTIVEILYPGVLKAKAAAAPSGRTALLACPPEEGHDLGLRMVADRFDMAGWQTHFLGADTPLDDIIAAARQLGADAVLLSSSTHFHRVRVRHAVDELRAALPGVDVWVGGPAFATAGPSGRPQGWSEAEIADLDALLGEAEAAHGAGAGGEEG